MGERFRAVSCATNAIGAFGETLARFRPSDALLAELKSIGDEDPSAKTTKSRDLTASVAGIVPTAWQLRRVLAQTGIDSSLRFFDLATPASHQYLRAALTPSVTALGLGDLDFGAVVGPHRKLTQAIARHVYELRDNEDMPLFAGLRYLSRLNPEWECWAVFADRMIHTPLSTVTIAPGNPDLLAVCDIYGLRLESTDSWE